MKRRNAALPLILLVLVFLVFVIRRWNEPKQREALDRNPRQLTYTRHALCRMDCRQISKEEIQEVIERGSINFNKSNRADRPCPTYAVQARTESGEYIRVILAQCPSESKIITCYNLEDDFDCYCPGDHSRKNAENKRPR